MEGHPMDLMSSHQQQKKASGCIVVVAKCPIPGKSKTRLIPLLGKDGSSKLAKAMLSDVLLTLEHCPELKQVNKVLLYAPGDENGFSIMTDILDTIGMEGCSGTEERSSSGTSRWRLLPMISPNLQSSDLGDILQHALDRVVVAPWNQNQEQPTSSTGVVFLGMDSPEIALEDIVQGLQLASSAVDDGGDNAPHEASEGRLPALLCPSDDGGYGMLCVPSTSFNKGIFQHVYWSHPLTAVSQLKALTDASIPVVLGRLMHDIDEAEDVTKFCQRLASKAKTETENKVAAKLMGLEMCSSYDSSHHATAEDTTVAQVQSLHPECKYTKLTLKELGILDAKD